MEIGVQCAYNAVVRPSKIKNLFIACGGQSALARVYDVPAGIDQNVDCRAGQPLIEQ